ncbi:hypothetical protein Tco_1301199 [Tanacetum coccineum]
MTSLTKTMDAKYGLQGIKDMVPSLWSLIKVAYNRYALLVNKWYGYGHLEDIEVRRSDQQSYKFMEGDVPRLYLNNIEDSCFRLFRTGLLTSMVCPCALAARIRTDMLYLLDGYGVLRKMNFCHKLPCNLHRLLKSISLSLRGLTVGSQESVTSDVNAASKTIAGNSVSIDLRSCAHLVWRGVYFLFCLLVDFVQEYKTSTICGPATKSDIFGNSGLPLCIAVWQFLSGGLLLSLSSDLGQVQVAVYNSSWSLINVTLPKCTLGSGLVAMAVWGWRFGCRGGLTHRVAVYLFIFVNLNQTLPISKLGGGLVGGGGLATVVSWQRFASPRPNRVNSVFTELTGSTQTESTESGQS